MKPLLIAIGASLGNALFIYSQRASPEAPNPFLFSAGTVFYAVIFCGLASIWTRSDTDPQYLLSAWPYMMAAGFGVFVTFVGFFLLHTGYGASQYSLVAVSSIFTVSIFVGVIIFREHFNWVQWIATALAVGAIILFSIGREMNS
ncbi:MAG: EamA family transporter [Octadecabacter sp.]|nr:EamA family transporter [Octadecabacter sp.]